MLLPITGRLPSGARVEHMSWLQVMSASRDFVRTNILAHKSIRDHLEVVVGEVIVSVVVVVVVVMVVVVVVVVVVSRWVGGRGVEASVE